MNERIQELIKQCRWQEIVVEDGEEWIHAHFDEHKFAELIIRECAHLVGGYTKENEFGSASDVKEAYEEITKHFGVES